jgi:hypothetical protein
MHIETLNTALVSVVVGLNDAFIFVGEFVLLG